MVGESVLAEQEGSLEITWQFVSSATGPILCSAFWGKRVTRKGPNPTLGNEELGEAEDGDRPVDLLRWEFLEIARSVFLLQLFHFFFHLSGAVLQSAL